MGFAKHLREILASEKTVLVPGVYDAFSAKILKHAGFEVIYMTGSGVTASLTGMPDMGLLTMTEMVNQARNIVNATDLPLICDADSGYGNPINVIRMIKEYERAGVAGIHMEDQIAPKRCGHFKGKRVLPAEEMVKKIEAARYAREDEDFLLIARTDARSVLGLEEAIRRAQMYVESGADMLFVESPQSVEELKIISAELAGTPLLVNMVEGGKTPVLSFDKLSEMGFKIVLYPTCGIRAVAKTLQDLASHLYEQKDTLGFVDRLVSFEGRNLITGLAQIKELENRFVKLGPLD
ncbi:MAG: isocitrate lyase/PEP mutase family protein [Deltaproteobacteria bacterium]|nr:isocitrate lyase/PEP mutase family protein [Deltaproteobacteria bacterium]